MNEKKLIAVYGSLRKGCGNNVILSDSKLLGTDIIDITFNMVDLGAFPALVPSNTANKILIEVYEVTDEVYKRVERLEGYPSFYDRLTINTKYGDADIYFINKEDVDDLHTNYLVNKTNNVFDWINHYKERRCITY